jgi:hypothetical protein
MKNFLFTFLLGITFMSVWSQDRQIQNAPKQVIDPNTTIFDQDMKWENNFPKGCFCCEGVYNLPLNASISGPETITCEASATFTIPKCKGIDAEWSISPALSSTSSTANTFTISPAYGASSYTVTVKLRCGQKVVTATKTVKIERPAVSTPAFATTLTQSADGSSWNIDTRPTITSGYSHWWGIQYNGTYPNCDLPCVAMAYEPSSGSAYSLGIFGGIASATGTFTPIGQGTGKNGGSTGYGINYNFPNNSCFKITHYITICGIQYRQTQCVSVGTSTAKTSNGASPKPLITVGPVEVVQK